MLQFNKGRTMAWIYLVIAGLLEIVWAVGLKYTDSFTKPTPSAITILAMAFSFGLLSLSLKNIPMGTAYAVWVGIGAVGVALFGIIVFGESSSPTRLLCLGLIIAGIVGLKLISPA
jgi:quaternary ammonium compound-resistance protein SugE